MTAHSSQLVMESTWGPIHVTIQNGRICSCDLPYLPDEPTTAFRLTTSRVMNPLAEHKDVLQQSRDFIKGMFKGTAVKCPPIQWPAGTEFQRAIWKAMSRIPFGQTTTYKVLAERVGSPRAFRAAGQACGANPIPLFIPCHRVTGTGTQPGGFSAGLAWKHLLLRSEQRITTKGA